MLAATVWNWILLLGRAAFESGPIQVMPSIAAWLAMIVTIPTFRSAARSSPDGALGTANGRDRRDTPDVSRVARRIRRHPEYALDVVRKMEIDRIRSEGAGRGPRGRYAEIVDAFLGA